MKLNLGCGGDHKKGYLNIDAFDKTIADKTMSATNLKFDDNSVEEILMSQVIEHFGIAQFLYVLGECFRVLKKGGKLVIETPDIRESFQIYLKGEREDRKFILPWIYGVDIPGMQHRFCFPDDLLEEELEKLGFIKIKKEYLKFDEHQPILRVTCEKTSDSDAFFIITLLRKKLLNSGEINLDEQINALEKETLLEFFTEELKKFFKKKNNNIFEKMIIEGSIKTPKITFLFFNILIEQKLCPPELGKKYIQILTKLDNIKFLDILLNNLIQMPNYVGRQEELIDKTYNFGRKIVKELLSGSEKEIEDILKNLSKENKINVKYEQDFLSQKLVMLRANRLFQKGVKAFNLSNFEGAIGYFKKSSIIYRNQILTYWNLGRLYMLCENIKTAESYYKNALDLLAIISFDEEKKIKRLLEQEMSRKIVTNYTDSLISLRQIYEILD